MEPFYEEYFPESKVTVQFINGLIKELKEADLPPETIYSVVPKNVIDMLRDQQEKRQNDKNFFYKYEH